MNKMMQYRFIPLLLLLTLLFAACREQNAATDSALLAKRSAQISDGETVYTQSCSGCHGPDFGGANAPALDVDALDDWDTVEQLHTYISRAMPPGGGGSLDTEQYEAVTAYLLNAHRLLKSDVAVGTGSAVNAPIEP